MTTPAGWYPEPDGQQQRYWDGERWTEHVAPLAPAATSASETDATATGAGPTATGEPVVAGAAPPSGGGRGKVLGGVAAAVLVAAGGFFAWTQLSSAEGGASSPEDAVVALMDAVSDEDLVGVAEAVLPGERRTYADPALEGLGHLQRWGVLSDDFDTADVAGFDVEITDVETRTEQVADDLVNVYVSGTISGSVEIGDLPIGDVVLDRTGELDPGEVDDATETGEFDDLMITAVREDGRWYVSALYTAAEHARAGAGVALPSAGIAPVGADSPEAAVDGFIDAATSFDLEAVVARLNPDEAQVLQRYAPIFLADAQAELDDAVAEAGLTLDVDVETEITERDGIAIVTFTSFTARAEADGEELVLSFADDCLVVTAEGETEQFCAEDADADEALDLTDTPAGDLTAIFDDMDEVGLVVAQRDGRWYVSPIRTYSEGILSVMRAIDRDELERVVDSFEDGSMVEWLEDQLDGAFGADFDELLDDATLDDLPTSRPDRYGDDPELDALWDECESGDMDACDDLYWATGIGTEYEAFAQTCGGTVPDGGAHGDCADQTTATTTSATPSAYGDNPNLDALWDACAAGTMTACDDLYWGSGIGTEYEAFAQSCGNRVTEEAFGDCVEQLGETAA